MVKKEVFWLLLVTVLFAGLTAGSLVSRYYGQATVTLSAYDRAYSSAPTEASVSQVVSSGKLNINTASVKDLMLLPGIGEAYAQRIVDYRTKNGPYFRIEDLLNVSGIGQKRLEAIADLITVGG